MRRMFLVLIALVLAGCAGSEETGEAPPLPPPSAGMGLIRGVVVDDRITPVPEVTIEVIGKDLSTQTDENGEFLFRDVEPGTHFLKASRPGFAEVQQSIDVKADDLRPPMVRMLLERMPGTEPYVETNTLSGFISCSVGLPVTWFDCNTIDEQHARFYIAAEGRPRWVQTEIAWDSTQPLGDNLYVIQGVCGCDGGFPNLDGERFDEGDMESVHVARAGPEFLEAMDFGASRGELVIDVSASGPVLWTGLTLNQSFTVYYTFFYNMDPQEGWAFHRDGPHPLP